MTTLKKNSRIIDEMQKSFADLKKGGVISKKQIAEFEALRNLEDFSQVFLRLFLIQALLQYKKWEAGEKKRSGPSLKLLSILKK